MKSLRFLDRRAGYSLASLGLLLGMVVPSVFPAFASAQGQLDSRSIQMSNGTQGANGVSYTLNFTPESPIDVGGGLVVQFCDNSPLVGFTCNPITGLTAASATLGTVKYNTTTESGGAAGSIAATATNITWTAGTAFTSSDGPLHITFANIHNPTNAQTFYARVTTYTSTNIGGYSSATSVGTYEDTGSVALATTQTIGVTAYVLESMTFCVSGSGSDGLTPAPGPSCGATGQAVVSPSMTLGETVGTQKILDSGHVSTGVDYAQLSTNAAGGAVVNLQSNRTGCGGLVRVGNTNCDIKAQNTSGAGNSIAAGNALFGLKVGSSTAVSGASNPSGSLAPAGNYSSSDYYMDYAAGDTTGVTSTYGSPVFSSAGAVNQQYVPITFGASIANDTPAGVYSANLNMIATGTF